MKKNGYGSELFGKNMWCAAKAFTRDKFNYFMGKIEEKDPGALGWLDENHPFIWSRRKFSEDCKVDYINNNLSECFNSWVSKTKDFPQYYSLYDMILGSTLHYNFLIIRINEKLQNKKIKFLTGTAILLLGPMKMVQSSTS
jgi:hypothetical protein